MSLYPKLVLKVRQLFSRRALDREMSEEMHFHLEMQAEANVRAGMTAEEARYAALRTFGHAEGIKEQARDQWSWRWVDELFQDLRYAVRQMIKAGGFTTVVTLTLALGIGACTAIFSFVNAVVLRPMPYPQSERLFIVYETQPPKLPIVLSPFATYLALQEHVASFESIAAWSYRSYNVASEDDLFRANTRLSTPNFFSTLGVKPLLGRTFLPSDALPGKDTVVVLSYRIWMTRFAGRPDIIGHKVQLDDTAFTVIGVMPADFLLRADDDIFTPLIISPANRDNHERRLNLMARLRSGASPQRVAEEMETVRASLAEASPATYAGYDLQSLPLLEVVTKVGGVKEYSLLLLGAVGCLLLIACINIANLLLARASARHREMTVRAALGATRGRIFRQLMVESLLLALLGGAVGLVLGKWGLELMVTSLPPNLPRLNEITMDRAVLAFTSGLTVLTSLIFGFVPALQLSRIDLQTTLKTSSGRLPAWVDRTRRLRGGLIVAEVAFAFVLLYASGLFIRSLLVIERNELGYDPAQCYGSVMAMPAKTYPTPADRVAAINRFVREIGQVPGITAVAFTNHTLPNWAPVSAFSLVGHPVVKPDERAYGFYYGVTPDYFRILRIPLRQGRLFTAQDDGGAPRVALINEQLARQYFPGENPLGKKIILLNAEDRIEREIVGVVGDVRQNSLAMPMMPQIYEPYAQAPGLSTSLYLRAEGGEPDIRVLAATVHSFDPKMPFNGIYSLAVPLQNSVSVQRSIAVFFGVFAGAAVLLAVLGIYSVMSYNVALRTHDIGVRLALGARRRDVLALIFTTNSLLLLLGLAIGFVVSSTVVLATGPALTRLLYGINPYEPLTLGGIAVLLIFAASFACWLPARRAIRVEPLVTLRSE